MLIAQAGEAVTTDDGTVICRVKNDLYYHRVLHPSDFHEFAEGETPWVLGERYDRRCIRQKPDLSMQMCINGEWRP